MSSIFSDLEDYLQLVIKILPNEPAIETEQQYRKRVVAQVIASGATVEHVSYGQQVTEVDWDETDNTGWYFFPFGDNDSRDEGIGPNDDEFDAYENCWFYLAQRGMLSRDLEV